MTVPTDGYQDSYVAFMDILGFTALTELADSNPEWRKYLAETITMLHGLLPKEKDNTAFRVSQFSDCLVLSTKRAAPNLFMILNGCAFVASKLFDRGHIMRGGIAQGNFHHDNTLMFGPALIRAHGFDKPGTPPHISIHEHVMADIAMSPQAQDLYQWVRPDPWDLTPMLHTLHRFELYPQAGDVVIPDEAETYAEGIKRMANDMTLQPGPRSKWRWMQDYWNRTVAVKGVLARSE